MPNREDRESKLSIRQKQDFVYRMKEKRREASLEENKELNEGPLSWFQKKFIRRDDVDKNNSGDLADAKASIKKEVGKDGQLWDFYSQDGTRIPYDDYKKLEVDQQLSCIVIDNNGYFVRKGTEVLAGKKVKPKMSLRGKINFEDEENKVSDAHQGVDTNIKGRPLEWTYVFKDGDSTKDRPGTDLFDDSGKLTITPEDLAKLVLARDKDGNELKGADNIVKMIKRFQARLADYQKKKDAKSPEKESEDGSKAVGKIIWKSQPKNVDNGNLTVDAAEASKELVVTEKVFAAMKLHDKRRCYFGVKYSNNKIKVFSYQKALLSSALKKAFKLTEGIRKEMHADDRVMSLNESYTPARKGVTYDDSFETEPTDTKYNFDYKIDDTFG